MGTHELEGARIARIDGPAPDVLAISLHRADLREVLVARLSGAGPALCLLPRRPRGDPAGGAISKLRHHAQGARIGRLWRAGRDIVVLDLVHNKRAARLVLVLARGRGNALVLDRTGRVLTSLHRVHTPSLALPTEPDGNEQSLETPELLRQAGQSSISLQRGDEVTLAMDEFRQAVARKRRKLRRREVAIRGDLARGPEIAQLRHKASMLLASLHTIPPGARQVEVLDHTTEEPGKTILVLDDDKTAQQQADAWFRRARKLDRGMGIGRDRLELTEAELAEIAELLAEAEAVDDREALEVLMRRGALAGVAVPTTNTPGQRPRQERHKPFREFAGAFDRPIRVGKGAADNDALTLQHAAPHDLWLHARGSTGAHVVVPLSKNEVCPPELLADAGLLAAHFSKQRSNSTAEIAYTPRRHVRKPRGAPIGTVTIQREKVLALRPNPKRLAQLLAREFHRQG